MIVVIMAPAAHCQIDILHFLDLAGEKLVLVFDIFAFQIMGSKWNVRHETSPRFVRNWKLKNAKPLKRIRPVKLQERMVE